MAKTQDSGIIRIAKNVKHYPRIIDWMIDFLAWWKKTERRKKIAVWLLAIVLYVETTIHVGGLRHFAEYKDWYKQFPFIETALKLLGGSP